MKKQKKQKAMICGVARLRSGSGNGRITKLKSGDVVTFQFQEGVGVTIRVGRTQQEGSNVICFGSLMSLWQFDTQKPLSMKSDSALLFPFDENNLGGLLDLISSLTGLRLIPSPTSSKRPSFYQFICTAHPGN